MSNPFRIGENEEVGRFLISTQRFLKGDQVWEESALVEAPHSLLTRSLLTRFSCVSCCKVLENQDLVCRSCSWPCCNVSCSKSTQHRGLECKLLSKLDHRKDFGYLIFLRILLAKLKDPSRYQAFCTLSHSFSDEAPWKNNIDVWTKSLYTFLVSECQMCVSISEVFRILTAFKINSFEFAIDIEGTYTALVLYHYSSLVSNSCCPNLEFCFVKRESPDGNTTFVIRFHARKDIEPGDIFSIAYYCPPDMGLGTVPRQLKILMNCGFICKCDRCKDKTECGSYFQAVVCPECGRDKGYLLPLDPIETMISPWKCDNCDFLVDASRVATIINTLVETPEFLRDTFEATAASLEVAQNFLELQSGYLIHPNHYLLFTCRMHWLLGCSVVNEGLVTPNDKEALKLFLQIKSEYKICLPRCLEFMTSGVIAKVYFVMAHSYAAFAFKSYNLRGYEPGIHTFHKQWRVCKLIAGLLENCLLWKRMEPHDPTNQYYSRVFLRWSGKEKAFESEITMGEDMALECIRYLFVEF